MVRHIELVFGTDVRGGDLQPIPAELHSTVQSRGGRVDARGYGFLVFPGGWSLTGAVCTDVFCTSRVSGMQSTTSFWRQAVQLRSTVVCSAVIQHCIILFLLVIVGDTPQ